MTNRFEIRVLLTAILFLIPITGGLTTFVLLEAKEDALLSTSTNAYSPPKNIGRLVELVSESLVTINCRDVLGSGFSFGLDSFDRSNGFKFRSETAQNAPSTIVTNYHVLEKCLETNNLQVIGFGGKKFAGEILEVDEVNDLALVRIESELWPLYGADYKPSPGFWTMALGSPHGLGGSVTFGNVINFDSSLVFHTASLSPGNSGGPLIENEGLIYGVNSGSKPIGQNFNISIGVNAFCDRLIICEKRKYWVDK
jgi:S1-C subfamily serine protease